MLFSIKATREQHRLPLSLRVHPARLTSPLGSPRWFILRAAGTYECVREPITHSARQYQIQAGIISSKRGISLIFTCGFTVGPMACSHIWTGKTNWFISCYSTEFTQRKWLTAPHITPVSKWQPGKVDVTARSKSWLTGNYPSIHPSSIIYIYTLILCRVPEGGGSLSELTVGERWSRVITPSILQTCMSLCHRRKSLTLSSMDGGFRIWKWSQCRIVLNIYSFWFSAGGDPNGFKKKSNSM